MKDRLGIEGLARHLDGPAAAWLADTAALCRARIAPSAHGKLPGWLETLDSLPDITPSSVELDAAAVRAGVAGDCSDAERQRLERSLRSLLPWRKGPFELFGIDIDTEWRSDLKWDRVRDALGKLTGKTVLDVGCGSGYHALRMAGAGARAVVGIEPMPLYVVQFLAVNRYLGSDRVGVLPRRLEDLPAALRGFDTVLSMGVLYHRRSPIDHLAELRGQLTPGGRLLIETLVVEGDERTVLVPPNRYARMRNVLFIPSVELLQVWLARAGFIDATLVDVTATTMAEQRGTDWSTGHSLVDGLDPRSPLLTIEGHPAPLRAALVATAP